MNISDFKKSSTFTGQSYGTKVTIELDHSDLDIGEVFGAFKSIALGLGFSEHSWNEWIKETAYEIEQDERIDEWNKEDAEWVSENEVENVESQRASWNWDKLDTDWIGSDEDMKRFVEAIENPPYPNDALKKAAKEYKESEDEGPEFDGAGFTEDDREIGGSE